MTDRPSRGLDEARRLWLAHDYERALWAYQRAVAREPGNVRVVINAARCFGLRHRIAEARSMLDTLTEAAPENADIWHLVGETRRLLSQYKPAARAFERAAELGSARVETYLELASVLEQDADHDGAARALDRADAIEPRPWGALIRARLLRHAGDMDRAQRVLQDAAQRVEHGSEIWCEIQASLGAIRDQAGDVDGAIRHLAQCRQAQLKRAQPAQRAADHVRARFESLAHGLTRHDVESWSLSAPVSGRRVALLAGFPRSGTTLLEQMLDAHHRVVSIEERDVLAGDVFPMLVGDQPDDRPALDAIRSVSGGRLRRASQRYLRGLLAYADPSPGPDDLLLDKNPGATLLIPVLLRLVAGARVVVAIRDPRDVVLSCYLRYLRVNPVSVAYLTIESAAERYAFEMGAWLAWRDAVGAGAVEVRYEDVVHDPMGRAAMVLDGLGLGWDDSVGRYRDRLGGKSITSPTRDDVRRPIHTRAIGRWKAYREHLEPVLPVLEPFVRAFGYEPS